MLNKRLWIAYYFGVLWLIPETAWAMHLPDGILPLSQTMFWWALSIPMVIMGLRYIEKLINLNSGAKLLLALAGAFTFVLSALPLPSMTGLSSHPTGVGLGTVLFGPWVMSVLGTIVLLFQATLMGHGGLFSLGANIFSMGVVGPLVAFASYRGGKRLGLPVTLSVFISACLANLATYVVASVQMAWAVPDPVSGFVGALVKFLSLYLVTQVPLAISEGILTVVVFNGLLSYNKQDLQQLSVIQREEAHEVSA